MLFPFVSRAIYETERARCDRLMDELIRMRHAGFTAAPTPVTPTEQPADPEQQLLDRAERPMIEPIAEMIRSERPDVSQATAYAEARRMLAELNGGG